MLKKSKLVANLLITSLLLASCMNTDAVSVRTFVQDEIAKQFPEVTLEEAGEGEVAVRHKDGNRQLIDITPIQEGCKRLPRSCSGLVSRLLVTMQEGLDTQVANISLAQVLPIISAIGQGKGLVQQNAPVSIFVQPIAEKLNVRYAISTGETLMFLDDDKIVKLGVSAEVLRKEAFRNVETAATVNVMAFPGEAGVFQIFGRLAGSGVLTRIHADAVKNQRKCTELAIAYPRRGMTLFACASDAVNVARLREISARFLQPASAMISNEIYLLTDSGLAVIKR